RYQDAITALQTLQRSAVDHNTDTAQLNQSPTDQAMGRLLAQAQPSSGDGSSSGSGGLNYSLVTYGDLGVTLAVFTNKEGERFAAVFDANPARPGIVTEQTTNSESEHNRQIQPGSETPTNASPSVTTTTIAAGEDNATSGRIAASDPDGDALTFKTT